MQTQPAAKTPARSRKAAAAAKYSDNPVVVDAPVAGEAAAPEAAPADPAKVPTGLKAAKAATRKASRAVVVKVDGGATEAEQMAAAVNVLQKKTEAAAKRASRKPKKEAVEFAPVVVRDANNHSAIAVASNGRTVELIPMDSAGMSVTKLSADRFASDYKPLSDYPVAKAAKVYLAQTIGMDPKAKAVLEVLAAAEADKPIASGTLVALMSKHDEAAAVVVPADGSAPQPAKQPRAKAPKAAKADRSDKPVGSRAPAAELAKKIAVGDTKVESKVQPGSFRASRHNYIVSMAGKTVAEVLGAATVEGKRGIAYRDIQFAVSHGFIKLA